ncbi:MAG: cupin domain-containing protein [Candidatus Korobacteraceae bacterium]
MDERRYSCEHVVPIEQEPRHHLVIENEFVRAFAVEIAPHDRTLCHHHPNEYLLYVVGDGEIVSAARDEEPKKLSYHDGECELLQAGMVHVVENLSDTPFRNVVVELLPGSASLLRGPDPKLIAQEAEVARLFDETNLEQLFEDERAAIFSIAIKPRVEVAISGPAVVAMPYGTKLPLNYFGDIEVKHDSTCYLAWIPPQREATLWGCWEKPERAIIFQVGRTD